MDLDILQYNPFSSFVGPEFWHKFTQIKLDIDKLDGHRKNIWGSYCFMGDIGNFLEVNYSAFNNNPDVQNNMCLGYGVLINKNTVEEFKECDKVALLNSEGSLIWDDIENGTCLENPSLLSRFFILSFADLKKYHYFYWFAFPAPNNPFVYQFSKPASLVEIFNQKQILSLLESHKQLDIKQKSFFCVNVIDDLMTTITVAEAVKSINDQKNNSEIYFGFLDPSNNEYPGWILRNFIALITYKCRSLHGKIIKIISLRLTRNGDFQHSLLFTIQIPESEKIEWGKNWVGWERNDKGNFGPRFSNMSASMNPEILAETSVDLNLKLMKWRLLPNLNLDTIKSTKCLLLGAGTLGCSVARNLLAWGVRNITFVDSGKVSFSNPVRQNLFNHEDCLNGGKSKALAAADNLKKIFPGVNSSGTVLHIPMPGHPVGEALKKNVEKDLNALTNLISAHDIVFLLLDSREARWLPTLLAAHYNKLVINAALGFDSYLIMRHGIFIESNELNLDACNIDEMKEKFLPGHQLGCYFCNDVTSPGNSQKERTLDQQCTVTRPGVSNIAGALATELAIAITQHDKKINAPAPYNYNGDLNDDESILGAIPHSIRGFLINYQQILPTCRKFQQCIACSWLVLNKYRTEGNSFLMEVFNNAKYLEEITGLIYLHTTAETAEVWELDESDIEE